MAMMMVKIYCGSNYGDNGGEDLWWFYLWR